MGHYPKQLISELLKQLPCEVKDFYYDYVAEYANDETDFNTFLIDVLTEYFDEQTDSSVIERKTPDLKKQIYTKKNRWFTRFNTNTIKYEIEDKLYPFHYFYMQNKYLSKTQFKKLYGGLTFNELIEKLRVETISWFKNEDALLVSFPTILSFDAYIYITALKQDIAYLVCNTVKSLYNGSFDNFFKHYPTDLINKPLFSPTPVEMSLIDVSGILSNEYLITSDGSTKLRTTILNNETVTIAKTYDEATFRIFNFFLENLNEQFFVTHSVALDLRKIALLFNEKPSTFHYDKVINACRAMTNYTFEYISKKGIITFNIFDNIVITKDGNGKKVVVITAARALYAAIIKNRMTYVTTNNFNQLENNLSRIIYFALQRERIELTIRALNNGECLENARIINCYPFSFFKAIVYFRHKRISNNIQLIIESLEEFKRLNIAIKDFVVHKDYSIEIEYIPLSHDEYDDLTFKPSMLNQVSYDFAQLNDSFTNYDVENNEYIEISTTL